MSSPIVSCVIPTKNRSVLLRRAVKSVLAQTVSDLELIVVDDGSVDDTPALISSLAQDRRIKYIRNERSLGGGGARNRGIRSAQGSLIAFLDDDDEWVAHKLQKQLAALGDYAMVGSRVCTIRLGTSRKPQHRGIIWRLISERGNRIITLNDIMVDNCGMSPSSVVFRAEPLRRLGGFDTSLAARQGRDLFIRYITEYGSAIRVNEPLVVQHQEHGYERISESGGKRFDDLWDIHKRYAPFMSEPVRRLDIARIRLLEAAIEPDITRRRELERAACRAFSLALPLRFMRMYGGYMKMRKQI